MPEGKELSIFQPYQQADDTITRRYGGTGLGLSISSRLVELMGGSMWAENNPAGSGSTFHFTARLWLQRLATVEPRPILPISNIRQRVLIVDDNDSTRDVLALMVTNWGLEAAVALAGEEAQQMLTAAAEAGQAFAFILIDAAMPPPGGFALAESVRRNPQLPGSLVMVLPSPGDFDGASRCREMGLSSYVTKPVSAFEMADAITRALHAPIPVMHFPGESPYRGSRALEVLVVDDEPVNREIVAAMLRRWGHAAMFAQSGEEALEALRLKVFDAVLMDVQMPGLSGVEVTRRIRSSSDATLATIPVIGVSARAGATDRSRCLDAGMDDYVAKPVAPRDLFEALERVAGSMPVEYDDEADDREEPLVATADLLARVDGNAELARKVAALFVEDAPRMLALLQEAKEKRDAEAVSKVAHRMKGAIGNFPANDALALAARLEIVARRGDLASIEETLPRLVEATEDLALALQLVVADLDSREEIA